MQAAQFKPYVACGGVVSPVMQASRHASPSASAAQPAMQVAVSALQRGKTTSGKSWRGSAHIRPSSAPEPPEPPEPLEPPLPPEPPEPPEPLSGTQTYASRPASR